jgi:tetratricopeptide (TPR) repeat protein
MQRVRQFVAVTCLLLVVFLFAGTANAQVTESFQADLQRAMQLVQSNKMPEAIPILESLNTANPNHVLVSEALAYALFNVALPDKDLERRKAVMIRARQLAEKAQKLGDNSQLLQLLLGSIPPNGEVPPIIPAAKSTPATDALAEGEAAFSRGELDVAITHYERAFKLDPTLYEAPLFVGDAYFKMGKLDEAATHYARAIAINPDRDTAYRYWGDALARAGRLKEAKEKLVEAIVAEPYLRETWQFLVNWGDKVGVKLGHPRLDLPSSTGTPSDPDVWASYTEERKRWAADEKVFKEAYPSETRFRHSLREEVAALKAVAGNVEARLKDGQLKEQTLTPGTANLMSLHKAGLLESYVLFTMADEGISKDYVEYRKQNRDKLRQYLNDFVTGGK